MKLSDWHKLRQRNPRNLDLSRQGPSKLTIVTYIYGTKKYVESHFYEVENAIRETWFHLGMLPTVIVTNEPTAIPIGSLRSGFLKWIRIDICKDLKAGDLYNYSRDCIANLYKRFSTPYVLFIHPDGFPLRSGIEGFLGKYDYIGSPWPTNCDDRIGKLLLSQKNFVGNGGFSLRSRKICVESSRIYKRIGRFIPNIFILYEDYFITRFLFKFFPRYRNRISIAPTNVAQTFAVETTPSKPSHMPLGFHSASAFERITSTFQATQGEFQ